MKPGRNDTWIWQPFDNISLKPWFLIQQLNTKRTSEVITLWGSQFASKRCFVQSWRKIHIHDSFHSIRRCNITRLTKCKSQRITDRWKRWWIIMILIKKNMPPLEFNQSSITSKSRTNISWHSTPDIIIYCFSWTKMDKGWGKGNTKKRKENQRKEKKKGKGHMYTMEENPGSMWSWGLRKNIMAQKGT